MASTKVKKSKYELEAIKLLEGEENVDKQAERGYRKAESKIKTQIAQLEGKRVDLQDQIDDAAETVTATQFSLKFDLAAFDNAASNLENLEDQLASIEATLENRKKLLDSWK